MDSENEEGVLSIIRRREGCYDEYASISEFIEDLGEEAEELAHEESVWGCVLYEKHQQQQQQILTLLLNFASEYWDNHHNLSNYMVQFWGVEKEEGSHHYLSTKHHPFCFSIANKGSCWYRKLCRNHVYVVDVQGEDGDDEEHLGGVGRAYQNKQPESTPDLRLYSTHQFPMRDQAARCGFQGYMALPLFDSHTNQCYGVLEILTRYTFSLTRYLLPALDAPLRVGYSSQTYSMFTPYSLFF